VAQSHNLSDHGIPELDASVIEGHGYAHTSYVTPLRLRRLTP
jgi:hypothetical protein